MNFRLILVLIVAAVLAAIGLVVYGYSLSPTQETIEIEVTQ